MTDFDTPQGWLQTLPARSGDDPPESAQLTVFGDGGWIAGYIREPAASPTGTYDAWTAGCELIGSAADEAGAVRLIAHDIHTAAGPDGCGWCAAIRRIASMGQAV